MANIFEALVHIVCEVDKASAQGAEGIAALHTEALVLGLLQHRV